MRKTLRFVFFTSIAGVVSLVTASTSTRVNAQQTVPASTTTAAKPATVEEVLTAVRADMQGARADIMAKNVTLTAEQAAKFWPLFDKYQKEQNVIMDEQLKGVQTFVDRYQSLDDAGASTLISAHLDRDAKMLALRQRWLGEFQKVIGPKLAARVIQIDRRLSLVAQLEMTSHIPLIH